MHKKLSSGVKAYALEALVWRGVGIPEPTRELVFAPPRRWRFDFAWPAHMVALEVEGGVWIRGRHTRGTGFVRDMEKYNAAAVLGWSVLRVQPRDLARQTTIDMLKEVFERRRDEDGLRLSHR